jgi:hypothetical protein
MRDRYTAQSELSAAKKDSIPRSSPYIDKGILAL